MSTLRQAPMREGALETLLDAVEALSGAVSADQISQVVRSAARRLVGADGVSVVMLRGDRVHYVDEDAVSPLWKGQDFPVEACISGWAILNRQTVAIPDVFLDERIPHAAYASTFVKSLVMTPVRPDDPIGSIGAYWNRVRTPTAEEIANLEAVARATAVAFENLRLQSSLKEALGKAEASSRAKSDFLANMSHEIRTPLNGVCGALEVLARTPLSADQAELVDILRGSGAELERVLGDILDFARIDSGDAHSEVEPFALGDSVRDIARVFERRFAEKGVAFAVAVDPRAERQVVGDRARLKHILVNLLSNALKFTLSGRVTLDAVREDAGVYRITVRDTGVGFDPSQIERLFGRFEQADASSTRAFGGSGLGLAISRKLADLMGATLLADSRPGVGSTFALIAPLADARKETEGDGAALEAEDRPLRLLVVDDHATNRKVMALMLAQLGAEVAPAENGAEACRAFEAAPFDAILMDIQMPVMDGFEATRRIRALEAERRLDPTPILMLSANALPEHVAASLAAGADRHLAKPVQPALLFAALQDAIYGPQARAA